LGFIKPSASPTVDEPQVSFLGDGGNDLLDILSAPKLPGDEVEPLVFNPLTDYCNVEFEGARFTNGLEQIILTTQLSECNKKYPTYFSMQYLNKGDVIKELFIEDQSRDG